MKYLKNYFYIFCILTLLFSCDNQQTDELMIEKRKLQDQNITFLEYSKLPKNSAPNLNKYFDETNNAKDYLPDWLSSKLYQIEDQSSVVVSYKYKQDRTGDLDNYRKPIITLRSEDYMQLWGGIPFVNTFTPSVSPMTKIPELLSSLSETSEGAVQLVEYNYSKDNAYIKPQNKIFYLNEDFNSANGSLSNLEWDNRTRNSTRRWIMRTYNNDSRALATANGVTEPEKTQLDTWLISHEIDLTQAIDPKLTFDLSLGYFSGDLFFSVYLTLAEDYDMNSWINPAKWVDISEHFDLPTTGPSGYGSLLNRGEFSLKEYAGKKIRVGFRYTGKVNLESNISTTYELDNVKIQEVADQLVVSSSQKKYSLFKYENGKWEMDNGDKLYVLQPEDYNYLNVQYIDDEKASLLIPKILAKKIKTLEGNIKVVYKNTPQSSYADEFSFLNGSWTQISPLFVITKEDRYIYNESENNWNYKETIQ